MSPAVSTILTCVLLWVGAMIAFFIILWAVTIVIGFLVGGS
ncbi:MAG: hypothetical protein ACR2OE_04105 [Thermomicrobiales bacterium]